MSRHFGDIRQLAFVVPDIDSAIEQWSGTLGIGPFFVMRRIRFAEYAFRGQSGPSPEITIALAFSGALQIELIEQHDGVASVYLTPQGSEPATGFHHVSSWVTREDYDARVATLSAKGLQVTQQGVLAGSGIRLSYWETATADVPVIFEISDAGDPVHSGRVGRIQSAAEQWDGTQAVIEVRT